MSEVLGFVDEEVNESDADKAVGKLDQEDLALQVGVAGAVVDEVRSGVRDSPVEEPLVVGRVSANYLSQYFASVFLVPFPLAWGVGAFSRLKSDRHRTQQRSGRQETWAKPWRRSGGGLEDDTEDDQCGSDQGEPTTDVVGKQGGCQGTEKGAC